MSLDGKDKIPVKILRDTGATECLIVESILPFSSCTATGEKSPVLGVGLVPLLVFISSLIWYVARWKWGSVLSCQFKE